MRKVSPEKHRAIISTADQLALEGNDNPTNDDVRAAMGGGSIADISPVMRQWREKRQQIAGIQLKMPEAISTAGERFTAQLWSAADSEASKAIDTLQTDCAERITAIEGERDEAFGEITRLEEETVRLQQGLDARQRELSDQAAKLDALNTDHLALTVEREKALARADAVQESQAQIIEQLKEAQANNKALQNELIKLARATGAKKK